MEKLVVVFVLVTSTLGAIPIFDHVLDDVDVESISGYYQNALVVDFDRLAEQYVYKVSQEANRKVQWWDLYGKHSHLSERPQYGRYKIDITTGDFKFGKATSESQRPKVIQTKTFKNGASQPISSTISWETRRVSSSKWTVSEGFKAEWEVEIDSKIPIIDSQPKNKTTITTSTTKAQTYEEQDVFSISYSLKVPPKSELKATWIITERELEVPFEVEVYVKGYVAIWFSEKYNNHWLWFHPIASMANGKFRQFEGGLAYTVKGIYKGVRGLDSHIEIDEKELSASTYQGNHVPIAGEL